MERNPAQGEGPDSAPARRAVLRAAVAAAAGAGLTGGLRRLGAGPGRMAPGPPRAWLADRGAGAVLAVDAEGIVVRHVRVPTPARVEAQGCGGVHVTLGVTDRAAAPLVLELDADGRVRALRRAHGASRGPAGALSERSLGSWRMRPARAPGSTYVDRIYDRAGRPELALRVRVPFGVHHLAPDQRGGVWCVGGRALEVVYVARNGARSPAVSWPDAEGAVAACASDRLWVATPGALVRAELGPPGQRAARNGTALPRRGPGRDRRLPGQTLSSPGQILRLPGQVLRLPGQGGFHRLVDVSLVRRVGAVTRRPL